MRKNVASISEIFKKHDIKHYVFENETLLMLEFDLITKNNVTMGFYYSKGEPEANHTLQVFGRVRGIPVENQMYYPCWKTCQLLGDRVEDYFDTYMLDDGLAIEFMVVTSNYDDAGHKAFDFLMGARKVLERHSSWFALPQEDISWDLIDDMNELIRWFKDK